jgi:hypothetical protein
VARRDSAVVISTGAIRRVVVTLLFLALVALVAVFGRQYLQRPPGLADQIDKNAYQAVFLTGGQVFFGHATVGDGSLALADVFYLAPNTDTSQPQLGALLKRGSELHGPREPMLIEVGQILFVENMRDDSQVVAAIKRFKSGEQPAATPQPATQAPTTPTGTPRPSASR